MYPEVAQDYGLELQFRGDEQQRRRVRILSIVLIGALAVLGFEFAVWFLVRAVDEAKPQQPVDPFDLAWAQGALENMEIREAAPDVSYDRQEFGASWSMYDAQGCNTRAAVLNRDIEVKERQDVCVITLGVLHDPYTGQAYTYTFESGGDVAQIDHVVSLADAWDSGAWQWDRATREHFANDPFNLLAVYGQENRKKSSYNAAEWLPPDRSYHCRFVMHQILVKDLYRLSATPAESKTYQRVLASCKTV